MVSGPCNRRWDRRDQLVMDHMAHDLITLRSKITLILARGIIRGELHFITFIADSYIDIEFYCHWRQAQRPRINRVIIPDGDLIGSFRIRAVAFLRFNLIIQGTGWDVFCIQASVRIHILDACSCPRFYFINEGRLPCGFVGGHSYITCCDDRYSMNVKLLFLCIHRSCQRIGYLIFCLICSQYSCIQISVEIAICVISVIGCHHPVCKLV